MRRWGNHVGMHVCASKWQRKCVCVCLCYEICTRKIWAKKSVSSFLLLLSLFSFSFFRKGTVCCTRGSTTPGTLLWCKPESNSGALCHKHARTHTHTCAYQRAWTNLVIYVQSVQTEAEGWPHCSGVSGAGLLAHQQTPGTLNNTVLYSTVLCCTCYATAQLHDHLYTWQLLKLYPSIKTDSSPTKVHPQSLFPSAWNIQPIR